MDSTDQKDDFFVADEGAGPIPQAKESVQWSASEFVDHEKSAFWYVSAIAITASVGVLYYILMRELFGTIAVFVLGSLMLVGAHRKPRTMEYLVDEHGIAIGNKDYSYDDFRSFSVIKEGSIEYILLTPQKRWSPPLNIYFEPSGGQKIFDVLSNYLPFENGAKDGIDKFLYKIRF